MTPPQDHTSPNQPGHTKKFNVDLLAVAIALTLAALIRLNIIPHIGF